MYSLIVAEDRVVPAELVALMVRLYCLPAIKRPSAAVTVREKRSANSMLTG